VVADDLSASFGVGLVANVEGIDTTEFTGRDSRQASAIRETPEKPVFYVTCLDRVISF
jgi:hypothetical protein